jgi:hypothetical protein
MVKNHHKGNILVKCNSNNGVFDTVNDICRNKNETTCNIHNKISSHQQLTRNKVLMLYHQNIGKLRKQINELIMSFYIHTPHILFFWTLPKTYTKKFHTYWEIYTWCWVLQTILWWIWGLYFYTQSFEIFNY